MTLANDIIQGVMPDFNFYLSQGESLDDLDEYGFTPIIESVIANQPEIAKALVQQGVDINKPDASGRTVLHWAVDNNSEEFTKFFLNHGADPNAFNRGGQSVLVYPLLREQWPLKQVLYQHGADLNFAMDFINSKLLGHRYSLTGDVDILAANGQFIELDYEGFILEFSIDVIRDSLQRFINNFAARHLREYFPTLYAVIDGFEAAIGLLKFQHQQVDLFKHTATIEKLLSSEIVILPVAYQGHAIAFIRCGDYWAKIDRGENSLQEGSVNIYQITNSKALTFDFYTQLLFKRQTESYVHQGINKVLGLKKILSLPISSQIAGNCSWANIEAVMPTAFVLHHLKAITTKHQDITAVIKNALLIYREWHRWDQDRALNECIQSFYLANAQRQASKVSILAAIVFQSCDYANEHDLSRAEQMLSILTLAEYRYVLDSYLEAYCIKRLTPRGNNLLKILEDCGIDPNIGVNPVATGLKKKK